MIHKRQRPPCPITSPEVKDSEWIRQVAQRGLLILTRDHHIQEHRLEIAAVRDNGARMVALTGEDARSVFDRSRSSCADGETSSAAFRSSPRSSMRPHVP